MFVAGIVAFALLFAAVRAGGRFPGLERFPDLSPSSTLDYSRFPDLVPPLSARFISNDVVGSLQQVGYEPQAPRSSQPPYASPQRHPRRIVDHPPTNDDVETSYDVPAIPFTARTSSAKASRKNDPSECSPVGRTLWYRYRPAHDVGLIASTIGSPSSTALAVFTANDDGELTQVPGACDNTPEESAYVTFGASGGTTYLFQATDVSGAGRIVFNLDPLGATDMVSPHANSMAGWHRISGNGRFAIFSSAATDLVPGEDDTNGVEDEFVIDLVTRSVERVSKSSQGEQGNGESKAFPPAISADGRFVAFTSAASNLVKSDRNGWEDVFVRDRLSGTTTRVSVSSEGREGKKPLAGNGDPAAIALRASMSWNDDQDAFGGVAMSADGRYVVFDSDLTGLVPEDGPGAEDETGLSGYDVFLHDRLTRRTTLVSVSASGQNGDNHSGYPAISADGRVVAFITSAYNIVASTLTPLGGEPKMMRTAGIHDVVARDLRSGHTELVSVAMDGRPANDRSTPPAISGDGRFVAFGAWATNLVADDTNEEIDIFVRDRVAKRTELISVSSAGEQQILSETIERSGARPPWPTISYDGRYVTFHSAAPNLVPGDTDEPEGAPATPACQMQTEDAFVRDRVAKTTTRVSVTSDGAKGNGASIFPSISDDGRRILFYSVADNLSASDRPSPVPGACARSGDLFLHTFPVLR